MTGTRKPALGELPGERKQPLGRCDEVVAGNAATPRVGARAPVLRHAPGDHEPGLVGGPQVAERLEAVLVEEPVGDVELCLDIRLGARRADGGPVALRAEQEADRLRDDGLAGAGLARQRHQPGIKLELRLADQDEILDPQSPQHVKIVDRRLEPHTWPFGPLRATWRSPRGSG